MMNVQCLLFKSTLGDFIADDFIVAIIYIGGFV